MNLFSTYDEIDKTCFLCGENFDERKKDQEHFFPRWLLSKYQSKFEKQGYVKIQSNSVGKTDFWRQKLEVHKCCNKKFGDNLENKISNNIFNNNELWLWCMKIICGLLFHSAKYSRNKPDYDAEIFTGFHDNDFEKFWQIQQFLLGSGKFIYGIPFTVIELDYLFSEDCFFHTARFDFAVFWIAFNERAFLIFYNQELSDNETQFLKTEWKRMKEAKISGEANTPMFKYNLFTARMAIELFFSRRVKIWNPEMNLPTFDRPKRTPELETDFYRSFGFDYILNKNGSVNFESIPDF